MKNSKQNKGITLIALVITIIVLLILAGISIATLTGENGILSKADTAKKQSEITDATEQAKLDISTYIAEQIEQGKSTELNDSIIQSILTDKEYVDEAKDTSFISKKGKHEISYSVLYQNSIKEEEIQFTIEGVKLTAHIGETWYEWITRNYDELQGMTFGINSTSMAPTYYGFDSVDWIVKDIFKDVKNSGGENSIDVAMWISTDHFGLYICCPMSPEPKTNDIILSADYKLNT